MSECLSASRMIELIKSLILCAVFLECARAFDGTTRFVETKVIDSYSIAIMDEYGFTNSSPMRRLVFAIFNSKESTRIAVPELQKCFCLVDLIDSNRMQVKKTELGKQFGQNFFDLDDYDVREKMRLSDGASLRSHPAWTILFRPEDLFVINKPGRYTLQMRFQIVVPRNFAKHPVKELIRFPVIDCILVVENDKLSQHRD